MLSRAWFGGRRDCHWLTRLLLLEQMENTSPSSAGVGPWLLLDVDASSLGEQTDTTSSRALLVLGHGLLQDCGREHAG